MTTDKTPATLATVKHGRCVQLGQEQRSDLVPGVVRCAKCAFQLHRTNLYLQSGTVGAGDSKTEPCPNGCGPLWPVTWETWAREGWAEAERLHLEMAALSAQPSPGGQGDAVRALPAEWRARAEELSVHDAIGLTHKLKLKDCADELDVALASMPPSPAMGVTDAMVHAYSQAYDKNWEAQLRAPEDAPELGTFFAMRAGLQAALAARQPVASNHVVEDFEQLAVDTEPVGQEPVAWQMRNDERHNGFDDDQWREIRRDEYEARKSVMDGHGPKRLAGTTERGDLRIDDAGWMIELRQLFAAPPAQAVNRDQAAAWVPAKFFSDGVVAMTARRAPPSAMAVGLHGEYLPLFRQPPHAMALPEDAEEVSASLGDDAAAMLDANPEDERALNMQRAAEILDAQINAQVMPE
ncbi:hypothetical protein D7U98_05765 [Stenotrophomonas maltophilia]|uniref:hypothetical protein n=1 Tax=Stenotrophomonas maltophilia TaxID=40324 RepID=UPI001312EB3E|nr:hypothetical protein [Stenotrophomonas maltophilia]MBA0394911.1 hypothetical protein [Stenotrophomonas maltophilia]